jgi:hypothetical protein
MMKSESRRDFFRYIFLFLFGVLSIVLLKRYQGISYPGNTCRGCPRLIECSGTTNDQGSCPMIHAK